MHSTLPTTLPEDVGLSSSRPDRFRVILGEEIARGSLPGAVVLIARRDRVAFVGSYGVRDHGCRRSGTPPGDAPRHDPRLAPAHHPVHAVEWADPAIDTAYEDVWGLLMDGLQQ
jgi:hypothetical protein